MAEEYWGTYHDSPTEYRQHRQIEYMRQLLHEAYGYLPEVALKEEIQCLDLTLVEMAAAAVSQLTAAAPPQHRRETLIPRRVLIRLLAGAIRGRKARRFPHLATDMRSARTIRAIRAIGPTGCWRKQSHKRGFLRQGVRCA